MDEPEKCASCGTALPQDLIYCANCGHSRIAVAPKTNVGIVIVMVILGGVVAIPAWLLLGTLGATTFKDIGPPNVSGSEFGVSWGAAGFFIFVTLLAVAGLILQARARLSAPLRSFLIAFLCVTLGLFSICDIFALSSRG